ncbi:copper transport protein [Klenkia marina]|uniref:Copper transport protein n=1 Tax=Klenkia marina TaxID=1960309 RepID=A0A1G4X9T9_9ACTN|nr:copper resistance protein CopC [Klenkia marina]SCX37654.1 copper transport protein [Klenkia marina]
MRRSLPARFVLVLLAGMAVLLGTAGPASAHATVVTSSPSDGARLEAAPDEVTVEFDESVSLGAGYARVLGADGDRVDTGAASVTDDLLTIPLRADLPDASYVVTWRVVSADSHPVSGAYAFVVGDGELVPTTEVEAGSDVDLVVGTLLPVARWLGFGGIALGLGVPVFLVLCWPAGWASPRARRLTLGGLGAVAGGAVLSFLLQGPYAAATGVLGAVDPQLLGTTASSAYGATLLVRVVLAGALAAVLLRGPLRAGTVGTPGLVAGGVLGAGLVLTTAATGHPVAGALPGLAVAVTAVHVAAMTVWLGGLAVLLAAVLRPGVPGDELAAALPRYSRLAAGSVAALVVTGVVQSVREVGSPEALVSTTYGWVLVAKLVLVLAVLAVAGVSRVWVQQRLGAPRPGRRTVVAHAFSATSDDLPGDGSDALAQEVDDAAAARTRAAVADVGPFRRSVLLEVAVGAVVLALSAVLVGTPPAKAALAQPVDVTLPLMSATGTEGSVQLSLDPARPGPNVLHVYLFDEQGQLAQPQELRVTLTEAAQGIGPLAVDLQPAGPGHSIGDAAIPTTGTWTVTVTVRLDEFTALTADTTFPVR